MAHFFERPKKRSAKITTGTTSLRSGRSPPVRASSSAAPLATERIQTRPLCGLRQEFVLFVASAPHSRRRTAQGREHYMTIRTVAPSRGSREPTDLQTYGRFPQRPSVPSDLHTFTPPRRVKPKNWHRGEGEACSTLHVSFFDWPKNETQKTHPSVRASSSAAPFATPTGTSSLCSRRTKPALARYARVAERIGRARRVILWTRPRSGLKQGAVLFVASAPRSRRRSAQGRGGTTLRSGL
jgi:hypothetical protein